MIGAAIWRIVRAEFAATAFSGEGAFRFGGRWNSKGRRVVYTAGSVSLAGMEMLVHLSRKDILGEYVLVRATIPAGLQVVDAAELPIGWDSDPPGMPSQAFGDAWVDGAASAVLTVPSCVVPYEANYLLNPAHPDFADVTIDEPVPFRFDPRLKK